MHFKYTTALVVAVMLGAACDWRNFEELKGRTPVSRIGAPSGYEASDSWGSILTAASPPGDGSVAARFVSGSTEAFSIGIVTVDSAGQVAGHNVTGGGLNLLDRFEGQSVTAMADVPGADEVVLGAPAGTKGNLLILDLTEPYTVTSLFSSAEPQFGVGVTAGHLGGGAPADIVALSGNVLHVFVDGLTNASDVYYTDSGAADPCPIAFSMDLARRFRRQRAVAIGNLTGAAAQIAVGTPSTTSSIPGTVSIFNVDTSMGRATCALKLTGSEARFGQSIATGDFDGDGNTDLLIGAPPSKAYLFRGPITATSTATVSGTPGVNFGGAVAALDLDGDGKDEALVGDSDAELGSAMLTRAGNVTVFKGPMLATKVMPTPAVSVLTDREPRIDGEYGSAVAAMRFCPTAASPDAGTSSGCTSLPLVGAVDTVFAYFTLGKTDPRAK